VKDSAQVAEADAAEATRPGGGKISARKTARLTSRYARARSASSSGRSAPEKILGCRSKLRAQRGEVLDHVLFSGRRAWARPRSRISSRVSAGQHALDLGARESSEPATWRRSSAAWTKGDVLFIDEIHRLARPVEEVLYPAMEDFELNIVVGKGMGARTMPLAVKPVHPGRRDHALWLAERAAARPLRQHFHLDFYDHDELTEIVARSARFARHAGRRRGAHETREPRARDARASPTGCCAECVTSPRSTRPQP